MAKDPAFNFYVNDFEGGTRHMTDQELGCYVRLLMAQFNRCGKLPKDLKFLKRLSDSFDNSWPIVKEKFKEIDSEFIQNERLEHERLKRENYSKSRAKNRQNAEEKEPKQKTYEKHMKNICETHEQDMNSISNTHEKHMGNGNGNLLLESKNIQKTITPEPLKEEAIKKKPIGIEIVLSIANDVWSNQQMWLEQTCMANRLKMDDLKEWLRRYNLSISQDTIHNFDNSSYMKMFNNWLNLQFSKGIKLCSQQPTTNKSQEKSQLRVLN